MLEAELDGDEAVGPGVQLSQQIRACCVTCRAARIAAVQGSGSRTPAMASVGLEGGLGEGRKLLLGVWAVGYRRRHRSWTKNRHCLSRENNNNNISRELFYKTMVARETLHPNSKRRTKRSDRCVVFIRTRPHPGWLVGRFTLIECA